MLHIHYVKTPAGRAEMDARTGSLTSRERQIMLLCSGQRPLTVLMEVFGHSVVRELHELAARGLVQAHRQPPEAVPPPAPAPAAEATSTAAAQRLLQAREFAGLVAGSVGGAAAQALVARQSTITQPADILSYCVEVIELLFRTGDVERVTRVGYKLAELMPRQAVPLFIERMLDGSDPELAAALYEHLLSDRDLPQPDDAADI